MPFCYPTLRRSITLVNYILLLLLWLLPRTSLAQTTLYHNAFWSRLALTDTVNSRLRWEITGQYRTQNTRRGSTNLFAAYQFHSYALWLHYNPTKNLRLSFVPFSYFATKPLIVKPADIPGREVKEYRWAARLEHQQDLRYFNFINRYALEYRFRDVNTASLFVPNWRLRYMARLAKPLKIKGLKSGLTLFIQNEVMAQFGRAVKGNSNVFDQNRTLVGTNFDILKNVRLELAYQKIIQQRRSVYQFDDQNILLVALTFDYVFSQLSKKHILAPANK